MEGHRQVRADVGPVGQWRRSTLVWEASDHQFRMIPGTQTLVIDTNISPPCDVSDLAVSGSAPAGDSRPFACGRVPLHERRVAPAHSGAFHWGMDEEQRIKSLQLQAYVRAVLHTSTPHRVERLTSLRRVVRELERFCGPIEQRRVQA